MSDHLTITELERVRSREESESGSQERNLEQLHAHLDTCTSCQQELDSLNRLDAFGSKVRELTAEPIPSVDGAIHISGYELQHEIHRGGQGIVYAATQQSTGRRVAIKVLLHGSLASEKQKLRFEREIDLAARIHHPNVVSIVDRGMTRDQRGFLAMELVDGPTLAGYTQDRELSLNEKLRLFMKICDGVSAAHQRGVLHRDLKPGNILIDSSGNPKVLDFGLAKDDLESSVTIAQTIEGEFMGTLAYASPEQLRGNPDEIDSRTDIYALGTLLYELVTGTLPHDMSGPIDGVIRRVLESTPKRPSSLNPKIDPDLDTVILHALEHDQDRRYPSIDAFAGDVLAVLEHRPIQAKQTSYVYQMRKFARRHRVGVAMVTITLMGVLATTVALGIGFVRANAANQLAEERRVAAELELEKQNQVSTFFNDLLARVDPGQSGPDMRVTELLTVASEEARSRFAQYPDLRSNLQLVLGETYTRLGSYEQAETELRASIESMQALAPLPYRSLGSAHAILAQVLISKTRLEDANEALGSAEQYLIQAPQVDQTVLLQAQIAHQQGALKYEEGNFEQSISSYERSLQLLEPFERTEQQRIASQALIGLGVSLKRLERFEEALQAYDRALIYLDNTRSENHPDTLACLNNRAEILNDLGQSEEAEAQLVELLERREAVFGATHERVGITLNNLADLMSARGAHDEAKPYFDRAIDIFRINPGDPSLRLAITIHNAGVMHLNQDDLDSANPLLREAWEMSSGLLPENHWIAAQFGTKYAECLMLQSQNTDAESILEETYPALVRSLGEDHRRSLHAQSLLNQLEQSEME